VAPVRRGADARIRGRIYFTDPRYSKRENLELDREAVYRVDPDGTITRVVDSLTRPNGILVSGIYVFMPGSKRSTATLVTFVAMDEDPTNCTFSAFRRWPC
jgi:hypothetical protein